MKRMMLNDEMHAGGRDSMHFLPAHMRHMLNSRIFAGLNQTA
jgi:hypothetical protein